jgi:hypothetical protein
MSDERSYELGRQAARAGDPDWRDYMPLRWHIERWWSIHWPAVLTLLLLVGAVVGLLLWMR